MKKWIRIILSIVLLFGICIPAFALEFDIESTHVLFINLNEDTVLYEIGSEEQISIASLTKIMTSIVALEAIEDPNEKVVLSEADFAGLREANASVAGFSIGEEVTYRDLLYGLLLPSGADAAQALARETYGSVPRFVEAMNEKAEELHMEHSHFANTTGLDDPDNYSTLRDVETMFRYAWDNEELREILCTEIYQTSDEKLTLYSIMRRKYLYNVSYILGGKTGSTYAAGLCMASIAEYNGVTYLLITSGAPYTTKVPQSFVDAEVIYSYFVDNYAYHNILEYGDEILKLPTVYGKKDYITFYSDRHLDKYLNNEYKKDLLEYRYEGKEKLNFLDKKGEYLGRVDVYYGEELFDSLDIYLSEKVGLDIRKFIRGNPLIDVAVLISLCAVTVIVVRKKASVQV